MTAGQLTLETDTLVFGDASVSDLLALAQDDGCLGTLETARTTAIDMTFEVLDRAGTDEAGRFARLLTPKEGRPSDLPMHRFIGVAALLIPRGEAVDPNKQPITWDASNPRHFPLVIKDMCTLAVRYSAKTERLAPHIQGAVAIAQIAANHAVVQQEVAIA